VSFDRRLLLPLMLVACQDGVVHGLEVGSEPLLVLHGHVDLASLPRSHGNAPLLGALIWAAVPTVSSICLTFSAPEIRPACPDPYGVYLGDVEQSAPVSSEGDFDLAIAHLPRASVSVGDEVTRVAYGSMVVVEDVDGDGQIDLSDPDFSSPPDRGHRDQVVAATFHHLRAPQQRVIFREGGFREDSTFYPAPGCGAPPLGFSVGTFPPYTDAPAPPGSCSFGDAGQTITVPALATDDADALECRRLQHWQFVGEVSPDDRPPRRATVCLGPDLLADIPEGRCPFLRVDALVGCAEDPFCPHPDFDHRGHAPSWWPCH
jgi:hypothetical protein